MHAAPVIVGDQECINITKDVAYLEDPEGILTLEEVSSPAWQERFHQAAEEITSLNLGYSTSTYWIRFRLVSSSELPQKRLLEAAYFGLDELELFTPEGKRLVSGHQLSPEKRLWPHRYFVFPLEISTQDAKGYYYLKVYSSDTLILPLVLWKQFAFIRHMSRDFVIQGVYFGILISLILYSIMIYGAFRDTRYLLYTAFIFFTGVGFFFLNGFGNELTVYSMISLYSTKSSFALAACFGMMFFMKLLETKKFFPKLHRLALPIMAFHFLTALSPFFGISPQLCGIMLSAGLIPTVLLGIGLAIFSFKLNQAGSRPLLFAWVLLFISILLTSINNFSLIPGFQGTTSILQYSSMFEMLLLMLSISQRVEAEKGAKEAAVARATQLKEELINALQVNSRQLEAKVRRRTKDLEDALMLEQTTFERYRKFDAMMTHDFRTPLAIIANQSQLALKELEHGMDNSVHNMEVIQQAASRLNTLYTRMDEKDLELSRSQNNERDILNLSLVLREYVDEMVSGSSHHIELTTPGEPLYVAANSFLLRIAVANLIDNAEKYSPAESTIEVYLGRQDGRACIQVKSMGQPIPVAYREKIFDKNFRIPSRDSSPGRGFGLFIVRDIIESHDGSISLEGSPGEGNCFCISLPLAEELVRNTCCHV